MWKLNLCTLQIIVYFEMVELLCSITWHRFYELIQTPRKQILLSGRVVLPCFILRAIGFHSFLLFSLIFFFPLSISWVIGIENNGRKQKREKVQTFAKRIISKGWALHNLSSISRYCYFSYFFFVFTCFLSLFFSFYLLLTMLVFIFFYPISHIY